MSAEKGTHTVPLPADLYLPEDESLSAGTEILRCAQNDEFGGMGSAICYPLPADRYLPTFYHLLLLSRFFTVAQYDFDGGKAPGGKRTALSH